MDEPTNGCTREQGWQAHRQAERTGQSDSAGGDIRQPVPRLDCSHSLTLTRSLGFICLSCAPLSPLLDSLVAGDVADVLSRADGWRVGRTVVVRSATPQKGSEALSGVAQRTESTAECGTHGAATRPDGAMETATRTGVGAEQSHDCRSRSSCCSAQRGCGGVSQGQTTDSLRLNAGVSVPGASGCAGSQSGDSCCNRSRSRSRSRSHYRCSRLSLPRFSRLCSHSHPPQRATRDGR